MHLARELARAPMVERGSGHLVFISSLSGKTASPGSSLYSATKFGMRGYALGLREDVVGTGVGVTTVFPGFIRDAGMFHESDTEAAERRRHAHTRAVAEGVIRGIERNKPEVDVAPLSLRLGSIAAGIAPGVVGAAQRKLGSRDLASQWPRARPPSAEPLFSLCDAPHIAARNLSRGPVFLAPNTRRIRVTHAERGTQSVPGANREIAPDAQLSQREPDS